MQQNLDEEKNADKLLSKIYTKLIATMAVGAGAIGIAIGFSILPFVLTYLPWSRRVPVTVFCVGVVLLEVLAGVILRTLTRAAKTKSLMQAVTYFADLDVCHTYMAKLKWPTGEVKCPRCGCDNIGFIASRRMYQCKAKSCR